MLSNASLAGVLVSAVIGTIIVVVAITLVLIRLRTREKSRNVGMIPLRRTHDADLQTAPYDLEMKLLENRTGNDNNVRIELMAMFMKIEDCSNRHFPKGKARSSQQDPEIEMQLENIEIGQLDVKRFISLLWDPQHRRRAVKHFIIASICAALNIQNHDERKSLVQQDYMSFVKSLKTYTSQYNECLHARVRLLKRFSPEPEKIYDVWDEDGDEQCRRMIDHLCQILEPWSTKREDMTLRGSLTTICSQATVLGHKFTRLGPRYKFTCASADSLTVCPSVWQVTDSWGQLYAKERLLVSGMSKSI